MPICLSVGRNKNDKYMYLNNFSKFIPIRTAMVMVEDKFDEIKDFIDKNDEESSKESLTELYCMIRALLLDYGVSLDEIND